MTKSVEKTVEYRGKKYKLVFDLNVMEKIQEEYGTIEKWGAMCDASNGEPNIRALKFGLGAMINEAIEIENDKNGTNEPQLNSKQIGWLISELGMDNAFQTLNNTVVDSTQSTIKNE